MTVTGADDALVDGPITYTIVTAAAVSTDANYNTRNAPDVLVTNSDNDAAGITVAPPGPLATTEAGGTATFTVVLTTQPTAEVDDRAELERHDGGHGQSGQPDASPDANWQTWQTVTVTASTTRWSTGRSRTRS